jgi:hypothetical protein
MHLITVAGGLPELSNLSSWGCSLSMFATQIIQYCSVWFVVGMMIVRSKFVSADDFRPSYLSFQHRY